MEPLNAGYVSFGTMYYEPKKLKEISLRAEQQLTGYNVTRIRDRLGPEVESMDLIQLERRMDALNPEAVKAEISRITKNWEYPLGKPKDEVIERAIKMYMATIQICKEKNFSGFSYKCVDGVDLEMNVTHAVPSSLVADAGYPYVDENDIGNLIAELMLKWISGKQVMFLEHYEHHPEWILLGEDGYVPNDFIDGK
ncbi:MAG: hypothetical protein AB1798_04480, partial [Spirochaetota bacterium]